MGKYLTWPIRPTSAPLTSPEDHPSSRMPTVSPSRHTMDRRMETPRSTTLRRSPACCTVRVLRRGRRGRAAARRGRRHGDRSRRDPSGFGAEVQRLVGEMTEDEEIEPYEKRKSEHRQRIARNRRVAAIYAADKVANTRDIRAGRSSPDPERLDQLPQDPGGPVSRRASGSPLPGHLAGRARRTPPRIVGVLWRRLAEPGGDRQRHAAARQPETVHDDHRQTRQGESVKKPHGVTADVER